MVRTHVLTDLQFFQKFYDKKKIASLELLVKEPFARVSYRDAISCLQEEIAKDPFKWQFPDVEFGTDLATEHERWLAESKFNTAVFIYNHPKSIMTESMPFLKMDLLQETHALKAIVRNHRTATHVEFKRRECACKWSGAELIEALIICGMKLPELTHVGLESGYHCCNIGFPI